MDVPMSVTNLGGVRDVIDYMNNLAMDLRKPLRGALVIMGHPYWVILEYGSSPAEPDPGPSVGDDIVITLPDDLPNSKHHTAWYPIRPRDSSGWLVFTDRQFKQRFEKEVFHPGVRGRGFIRQALQEFYYSLGESLERLEVHIEQDLGRGDDTPFRYEVKMVFNRELNKLVNNVIATCPEDEFGDKEDGTHLSDAIGIILAT